MNDLELVYECPHVASEYQRGIWKRDVPIALGRITKKCMTEQEATAFEMQGPHYRTPRGIEEFQ